MHGGILLLPRRNAAVRMIAHWSVYFFYEDFRVLEPPIRLFSCAKRITLRTKKSVLKVLVLDEFYLVSAMIL